MCICMYRYTDVYSIYIFFIYIYIFFVSEKVLYLLLKKYYIFFQDKPTPLPTGEAIMCAYKLCKVEFRYWGMQTKIEKFIHDVGKLFFTCTIAMVYVCTNVWCVMAFFN